MTLQYSPYALPLFGIALLLLGLAIHALRRHEPALARTFGLLMLSLFFWTLFLALSISGSDVSTQILFNRLKYIGVVFTPPLWLVLALQYTNQDTILRRNKRNLILLFLPEVLFLLIVLTDGWTHWWWPQIWADEFNGYLALGRTHSTIYYLGMVFNYGYIVIGMSLYIWFYWHSQALYKRQTAVMTVAAIIPLIGSIISNAGLGFIPWGLDAFAFAFSGILMTIAIFKFNLLDIVPIARRIIIEELLDGIVVIDRQERIVDINPMALTMFNTEKKSLLGENLLQVVNNPALLTALETLPTLTASQPYTQTVHLTIGTTKRIIDLRVTALKSDTDIVGKIIVLHDITEQMQAQIELENLYRESERVRKQLALIIKTVGDPIVLLSPNDEILASNPAAQSILPASSATDYPEVLRSWLAQAHLAEGPLMHTLQIDRQVFQVAAAPLNDVGLVFTMHDVTHLKELSRLKDEFVATVSHDLRSPLTSVLGFASLARKAEIPEARRLQALERIESSARHMADLIKDLLDLAAIEAEVEQPREFIRLDLLAREACENLEGAAVEKGLQIMMELEPLPPILAIPRMIIQVWNNLIGNAIKYTPSGTITVRTALLDDQIHGEVADTGIGIDTADLPYVFDKFYRVESEETEDISGTGLGLALVKSIIERHGGQVWIKSTLGQGSQLGFFLPLSTHAE